MKIIGITGPTGAGKTTALHALTQFDGVIVDADAVYHRLLRENKGLKAALAARFGDCLDGAGGVDRKKLGRIVFADANDLEDLNRITHQYVGEAIAAQIDAARQSGRSAVAIDAIALLESGLGERCDITVAVLAPVELRIKRIMAREGISEEYARKRVAAQREDDFFRAHCTYVLENAQGDTAEDFLQRARDFFAQILT